jgi:LuxR family maltose regulon positive regulatory protein
MQEPLTFQRWMKRLRAGLDLTQEMLAEQVGCATHTIRTFERGTRRPSRDMVERLAEVLHVPQEQRAEFMRLARAVVGRAPDRQTDLDAERPQAEGAGRLALATASSGRSASGQTATPGAAVAPAPILATKLYVPKPRSQRVARPQLLARLNRGLAGSLTIVAAPAGFGKTTLLAEWVASILDRPGSSGRSAKVAWLSLDTADRDPTQFLHYLVAALQGVAPEVGRSTLALIQSAHAPPLETVLALLVNELTALPEPCVLVLDDYHAIDTPAVHQLLTFLLDHLPPQLHLVVATRIDPPLPLSRLRARRQLTELRAHDLRFTLEEAAVFLREVMGLPLTADDVAALETRMEGWIAGLQLAALSLQDRPHDQMARFIDALAGSNRFVVDYLVDEVLARQPAHLQMFLLQTSILERLCGPLCDAVVLGNSTAPNSASRTSQHAYSQMLLEELERSNLFIVPLDEARRWYRYHHLFAQVLRHRLLSGTDHNTVATLHARASAWFEQQGLIDDAVRQAFAAQDRERATALIERHAMALLERSEEPIVRGWVEQLPPGLIETRPRLALIAGWLFFSLYRFEALDQLLQTVLQAPDAAQLPVELRGEIAVLRATAARGREQYAAALEFAHEALALLPAEAPAMRARAIITIGICLMHRGEAAAAEAALGEAAAIAQSVGSQANALIAAYWLATLYNRQGRLGDTVRVCEQIIAASEVAWGAPLPLLGAARIGLGGVWYERNELERAESQITEGLRLLRGSIEQHLVWIAYVVLAHIHQARGAEDVALRTLEEADAWAVRLRTENPEFHEMLAAQRARIWLRQGNLAAALQWAATCRFRDELRLSHVRRFAWIRVRLAHYRQTADQSGLDELASIIARLMAMVEAQGWVRLQFELLILQALVAQAQGTMGAALNVIERALTLAAPEGYVRLFVDEGAPMAALLRAAQGAGIMPSYVATLLAAFPTAGKETGRQGDKETVARPDGASSLSPNLPVPQSLAEPLTARELEVLQLLAAGQSNQAIAQRLIVAVGTVKRHVNSILSKLDVQSRLQAVARARELGLV